MRSELVVLKLGGSVITEKNKPLTPNLQAIRRLSGEIAQANVTSLVLVHGGGSYGHPIASAHRISLGFKDRTQIVGFSRTHEAMVSLNTLLVGNFLDQGLPALGMAPSSFIVTKNGRIHFFADEPLKQAINTGLVPVLYGDAMLDVDQGFSILSGDQISSFLAVRLDADRLIMGVDVDGVFDADPKRDPTARLMPHLKLDKLEEVKAKIQGTRTPDVTGGMWGKILELKTPVAKGVQTTILNALKPGVTLKALRGEEVVGTKIEI